MPDRDCPDCGRPLPCTDAHCARPSAWPRFLARALEGYSRPAWHGDDCDCQACAAYWAAYRQATIAYDALRDRADELAAAQFARRKRAELARAAGLPANLPGRARAILIARGDRLTPLCREWLSDRPPC